MQITIVQAEIEQAITDFIHRQINVRDGMLIQIDLKATRGDHGFQAVIDIVDPNSATIASAPKQEKAEPEQAPVPEPAPTVVVTPATPAVAAPVTRTRVVRAAKAVPEEKPAEPVATPAKAEAPEVQSEPEDVVVEPVEALPEALPEAVPEKAVQEVAAATEAPTKPRQSLFSNLPRPSNG